MINYLYILIIDIISGKCEPYCRCVASHIYQNQYLGVPNALNIKMSGVSTLKFETPFNQSLLKREDVMSSSFHGNHIL